MARNIKEKIIILYLFFTLIFLGCANQLPPGGGEVDLVPPEIIGVYPSSGTTDFKDDHIEFEFSKYVERRTFQDALFISPAIEGELEYDWTGKSVTIYFPGRLKQNITYVVTVGTDLQDYNNHNRMAESYSFVFSTGNKIDNGSVSGKIFSDKPDGIMMFAYLKGDSTLNPMLNKPDYVSQSGKEGQYQLFGLKYGEYRIFAVRDQFHDFIYQPDQDEIGIPYKDIYISSKDTMLSGLNFMITKFDTLKPRFSRAVMTDANHILLNFSKDIDSSMVSALNFIIYDSTSKISVTPNFAFKGNTKPTEMVLVTDHKFSENDEVYVIAKKIIDKYNNVYINDETSLTISNKRDTTKFSIIKTIPSNRSSEVDFKNQSFLFYFNDAFNSVNVASSIAFEDTLGKNIPFILSFPDDASLNLIPKTDLEPNTFYKIKIDLSKFVDISGDKLDSIFVFNFKTINGLDFTGISGQIENKDLIKNPFLILQNLEDKKIYFSQLVKNKGNFSFDRVLPGKYKLWCFNDKENKGTYFYGKVIPFETSDEFWVYPDTLNLRARWNQTNINFIINK